MLISRTSKSTVSATLDVIPPRGNCSLTVWARYCGSISIDDTIFNSRGTSKSVKPTPLTISNMRSAIVGNCTVYNGYVCCRNYSATFKYSRVSCESGIDNSCRSCTSYRTAKFTATPRYNTVIGKQTVCDDQSARAKYSATVVSTFVRIKAAVLNGESATGVINGTTAGVACYIAIGKSQTRYGDNTTCYV